MFTLNCKGTLLVTDKPLIMGIINVTPDSFYSGSRFTGVDMVLRHAEKMLHEQADILDIGGQSTRPGSQPVPAEIELSRVAEAIAAVCKRFPEAIVSIDTYYAGVAKAAVDAGASIVNDISAGSIDVDMIPTVAALRVPYVLMHMKGSLANMQQSAQYEDVTKEVFDFFVLKLDMLRRSGIHDVIIDPGFGFGKNIRQNFELLRNLSVFKILGRPVLSGISRKSTIYKTLDITAEDALNGTTVLNTIALMNGAGILRVHDVKEARETIQLVAAYAG